MLELLLSAFWAAWMGVLSALRPSTRKSIVSAYLRQTRGRLRDVMILTLAVTGAQAGGVLFFGLASASAVAVFLPKHVLSWLQAASGAVVVGVGVWMVLGGVRRGGDPTEVPTSSEKTGEGQRDAPAPRISARLVALGASSGMVPSPEALVVFVAAVGRGELLIGVALVLAYSFGMALTLALAGLASLRASQAVGSLFGRLFGRGQRKGRLLPILTGLLVVVMGLMLIASAVRSGHPLYSSPAP